MTDQSWFSRDRFGLFIHWGLYALPARHEWVKQREEIPDEQYDPYFKFFDPDLYDPRLWAKAAAGAGMKYFVVTTKHHEGFCLWDSQLTDYKATNTPAARDLIGPMIDAFRDAQLRVGFYHSLIDWHHSDFVIDDMHSMRNHPDREKLNKSRQQHRYIEYLHGQARELLSQFGTIDVMFCDFSYPASDQRWGTEGWQGKGREEWESEELIRLTRELQPNIVVNDRLDLNDVEGGWDYRTPEQFMPREWVTIDGKQVPWETCQTFSGSWGYHRDESSWKSVEQLVRMLVEVVSKGGNLLLNVGPTGRGEFDARALERLSGMGEWMLRHGRSIYGCTQAPAEFVGSPQCCLTYDPERRRIYAHVFNWPFERLHLDGFAGKVEYAQLLNDASEIQMTADPGHYRAGTVGDRQTLTLKIPVRQPDVTVPVIELFLKS